MEYFGIFGFAFAIVALAAANSGREGAKRIADLARRMIALERWAQAQGYEPPAEGSVEQIALDLKRTSAERGGASPSGPAPP